MVGGSTLPSLETEVRAVWLSPYRTGLAGQRHQRLQNASRFGGMLLSLFPFEFRSAVNPEVSFWTSSFCEGNLAPGEMAHVIGISNREEHRYAAPAVGDSAA